MLKLESQFSVGWADGYHVDGGWGGMQIQVKSVEDCMKLLILGDRNRCFAFTKLVSSVVGKLSPKKWEKKEKKGVECQQQHTPSKLHCGDFSMDCRRN